MDKYEVVDKLDNNYKKFPNLSDEKWVKLIYAKGLILQIDKPPLVKVPKYVANWFELNKDDLSRSIFNECTESQDSQEGTNKFYDWLCERYDSIEILCQMKNGYEIIEPKYLVPVPNLSKEFFYTVESGEYISFCQRKNIDNVKSKVKFTLEEVKQRFPELIETIEEVDE